MGIRDFFTRKIEPKPENIEKSYTINLVTPTNCQGLIIAPLITIRPLDKNNKEVTVKAFIVDNKESEFSEANQVVVEFKVSKDFELTSESINSVISQHVDKILRGYGKTKKIDLDALKTPKFPEELYQREALAAQKKTIEERKAHPFLNKVELSNNATTSCAYEHYDGVNIYTGDILRVRNLKKDGKDREGNYLYSGYMYYTPNENDVEASVNIPKGCPVCFVLPKRLADIAANESDKDEVNKVLEFLSDPSNFTNYNQLTYIGAIQNGVIEKKIEKVSKAIQDRIRVLQDEYNKQHNHLLLGGR